MTPHPFRQSFGSPLRLSTNALFVLTATLLLTSLGWLIKARTLTAITPGAVPLQTTFSPPGMVAFAVWMALAVLTSVVLPLLALLLWRRKKDVGAVLTPYLGVLFVQIPTEILFARLLFPNMTALIGSVYTSYRLYQLWYFRHYLIRQSHPERSYRFVHTLLVVGLCFWTINLAFLVFMLATRVIRF